MKPGRELDALVAEKVMGSVPCDDWHVWGYALTGAEWMSGNCGHAKCYPREEPVRYSEYISAAWQVLEKVCENGARFLLGGPGDNLSRWQCTFHNPTPIIGWGDTAPHAICLAALEAVEK